MTPLDPTLPLQSARLVLRRLTQADLQPFLAYRNDPEIARYQSWEAFNPLRLLSSSNRSAPRKWAPANGSRSRLSLKDTDLPIGDCAVKMQRSTSLFPGRTIARAFATEALSALLHHLFLELKVQRVIADTDPHNAGACRLMERLGLCREAHFRQSFWFKGTWADQYIYSVLRSEWLSHGKSS